MHRGLIVYQKSIEFVTDIYRITKKFPKEEIYGLISQIRRSAVSIPTDISEGSARKGKKEFNHFLYVALASWVELETLILIAINVDYIDDENYNIITSRLLEITKMLSGLINAVKREENSDYRIVISE